MSTKTLIIISVVAIVASGQDIKVQNREDVLSHLRESFLNRSSDGYEFLEPLEPVGDYGHYKYPPSLNEEEVESETVSEPEERGIKRYSGGLEQPDLGQTQHVHHHFHYTADQQKGDDYQRVSKNYGFERPVYQQGLAPHINSGHNSLSPPPPYKNQFNSQQFNSLPNKNHYYNMKDPIIGRPKPVPSLNLKQDNFIDSNCMCVPYQYCSMSDVVDRSGDVVLPLDPRNNGGTEGEDVILANSDEQQNVTSKTKRETKNEDIEGRFFKPGGNVNKKTNPTVGISFGLPIPSPPINPYLNYNGLNLGLVNVNPFFSLQYTKDDYGSKVIHPSINLHVTPNEFLLTRLIGKKKAAKNVLFANKFNALLNGPHAHGVPGFGGHVGPSYGYGGPTYGGLIVDGLTYGSPSFPSAPHYPQHHYGSPSFESPPYLSSSPYRSAPISFPEPLFNQKPSGYPANFSPEGDHSLNFDDAYAPSFSSYRNKDSVHFENDKKVKRSIVQDFEKSVDLRYSIKRDGRCDANTVCCRRPYKPQPLPQLSHTSRQQCGIKSSEGINGRIKTPAYTNGNAEFGEYPWQVAILKKDPKESIYICGGTLISPKAVLTAAHTILSYNPFELRARLGEWDVNHDVEFYPFVERDVAFVKVHPEYYAGTLQNDIAIISLNQDIDFTSVPHVGAACLPNPQLDFTGQRCWTTGWGKNSFGEGGKYQNILKEVDVPVINKYQCQNLLRQTRLGPSYNLSPGMLCAGGEEGKDACKGDGGGGLVCVGQNGLWYLAGIVSWGIGCGLPGVPGVYVDVALYDSWIKQNILL